MSGPARLVAVAGIALAAIGLAWVIGTLGGDRPGAAPPSIAAARLEGAPIATDEDDPDAGSAPFLAFARDFRDFRRWERHAVDGAMIPLGAEPGPTYVYVNRPRPAHAQRWPTGTILVKTIENGPPETWVVHAMAKRGATYNHEGTIGWEFFELRIEPDDEVSVVWRGQSPPSGHGYGMHGRDAGIGADTLVCNDCHSLRWQSDGVLTPDLALVW